MDHIVDRFLLLCFCLLSLLFVQPDYQYVVAFLIAVTFSAFCFAYSGRLVLLSTELIYVILSVFIPECLFFFPLAAYDYAVWLGGKRKAMDTAERILPSGKAANIAAGAGVGAAAVVRLGLASAGAGFFGPEKKALTGCRLLFCVGVGIGGGFRLRLRTDALTSLKISLCHIRDDGTEIKLLLEERNQALLEKQDNEIFAATLRERNRIAREIHDNVGHMLTRAILMVGALRTIQRETGQQQSLAQLEDTLNQAMNSIRKSVHDLYDESINLQEALETMAREFEFCPVTLQCGISPDMPREVKYSFLSIVGEALANVSKHSGATAVWITVQEHPGFYQLIVKDNGNGADVRSLTDRTASAGIGLKNMQSRIRALNGNFRVRADKGFGIFISVPRMEAEKSVDMPN